MVDSVERGRGTYGVVFNHKHHVHGDVVIKRFIYPRDNDEGIARTTLRELNALANMESEFIIDMLACDVTAAVLPRRLCSLHDAILQKCTAINPLGVLKCMYHALAHMHGRGYIHRDIKPGNILVKSNDNEGNVIVQLADFGTAAMSSFARSVPLSTDNKYDTHPITEHPLIARHHTLGVCTLNYCAPEALLGSKYTHAVDYWALGLVLLSVIERREAACDGLLTEYGQLMIIFQKYTGSPKFTWRLAAEVEMNMRTRQGFIDKRLPYMSTMFPIWRPPKIAMDGVDLRVAYCIRSLLVLDPLDRRLMLPCSVGGEMLLDGKLNARTEHDLGYPLSDSFQVLPSDRVLLSWSWIPTIDDGRTRMIAQVFACCKSIQHYERPTAHCAAWMLNALWERCEIQHMPSAKIAHIIVAALFVSSKLHEMDWITLDDMIDITEPSFGIFVDRVSLNKLTVLSEEATMCAVLNYRLSCPLVALAYDDHAGSLTRLCVDSLPFVPLPCINCYNHHWRINEVREIIGQVMGDRCLYARSSLPILHDTTRHFSLIRTLMHMMRLEECKTENEKTPREVRKRHRHSTRSKKKKCTRTGVSGIV